MCTYPQFTSVNLFFILFFRLLNQINPPLVKNQATLNSILLFLLSGKSTFMKKLLLFCLFSFALFSVQAHEYYFAFGEIEYNETTKKFEITLEMSAHDVESDLKRTGVTLDKHIEDQAQNKVFKKQLETYLLNGFSISSGHSPINLSLMGFDVLPNGQLYAYLESSQIELDKELHFKFDLLMELFPNQQNKITLIHQKRKQTAVFLPTKPTEIITL